jgi:hypothetical protein
VDKKKTEEKINKLSLSILQTYTKIKIIRPPAQTGQPSAVCTFRRNNNTPDRTTNAPTSAPGADWHSRNDFATTSVAVLPSSSSPVTRQARGLSFSLLFSLLFAITLGVVVGRRRHPRVAPQHVVVCCLSQVVVCTFSVGWHCVLRSCIFIFFKECVVELI